MASNKLIPGKTLQIQVRPGSIGQQVAEVLGSAQQLPPKIHEDDVESFKKAIEFQKSGDLDAAKERYRGLIDKHPNIPLLHNNLGALYHQKRELDEAFNCWQKALQIKPDYHDAYNNLGVVYLDLDKPKKALAYFRKARELKGEDTVDLLRNTGIALIALREYKEADEILEKADQIKPGDLNVLINRAKALDKLKKNDKAMEIIDQALETDPNSLDALNIAGILYRSAKRTDEAYDFFKRLLEQKPDFAWGYNNCAAIHYDRKNYDEALKYFTKAHDLEPGNLVFLSNVGSTLRALGQYADSLEIYEKVLALIPEEQEEDVGRELEPSPEQGLDRMAGNNLRRAEYIEARGKVYNEMGMLDKASEDVHEALRLDPTRAGAHFHLGILKLTQGDYETGWTEYDWRWRCEDLPIKPKDFEQPEWDGRPLPGKTVLIHAEQGLGDSLQFARYLPFVRARSGRVMFEHQKVLTKLMGSNLPVDVLIQKGVKPSGFHEHCPLLSVPGRVGGAKEDVPFPFPYIRVDEEDAPQIHKDVFTVGILWRGNPDHAGDRKRSVKLEAFKDFFDIEGIAWHCLQKDPTADELALDCLQGKLIHDDELKAQVENTAALISRLDLVISVDTMVAHLSGAIGVPTWVMLPQVPDWRWGLETTDTPWYANMELFRQDKVMEWEPVLDRMRERLVEWVRLRTLCRNALINEDANQAYQAAKKLQFHGDNAGAEAAYLSVLDRWPEHIKAMNALAALSLGNHDDDEAGRWLAKALSIAPDYSEALLNQGMMYRRTGDQKAALLTLSKALGHAPRNTHTLEELGDLLMSMSRYVEAAEVYGWKLKQEPEMSNVVSYQKVANALFKAGRSKAAADTCSEAIRMIPGNMALHILRANIRLALGDLRAAWEDFEWRWAHSSIAASRWAGNAPVWHGQPVGPRGLLIYMEQSLEEALPAMATLPKVLDRMGDAPCYIAAKTEAITLLERSFPKARIIPAAPPQLEVDAVVSTGDLLRLFASRQEEAQLMKPALIAPKIKEGKTLDGDGPIVGVNVIHSDRSDWQEWSGLFANKRIRWLDVSTMDDAKAREDFEESMGVVIQRIDGLDYNLDLNAASTMLSLCDLVIGDGDASGMQLAAALGKTVWVRAPMGGGWFWGGGWQKVPWYPTACMFRHWPGEPESRVMKRIEARFEDWLKKQNEEAV